MCDECASKSFTHRPYDIEAPTYNEPIAKLDTSAISTDPEHLEGPIITQPNTSNAPQYLDHPVIAKPDTSAISTNHPEHLEDHTYTKPAKRDASASSTISEHLEDPVIARPDISAISNTQEHLEDPILAEPDVSERLEDPLIATEGAQSSHDASLARPPNKSKNQRKRDKKQAKRLLANQDPN